MKETPTPAALHAAPIPFRRLPGAQLFRMGPGSIALALVLKYVGLSLYGVTAVVVEVPSFVQVTGDTFAVGWAGTVCILSVVALLGVRRSWIDNKPRLEFYSAMILSVVFAIYSVVIIVRGVVLQDWESISLAWLPFILAAFPMVRALWLIGRRPAA